jgi:hypothetical protein
MQHTQISYIHEKALTKIDFMASSAQNQQVEDAVSKLREQLRETHFLVISDLQCYQPMGSEGSAVELLQVLEDSLDDDVLDQLRPMAEAVDNYEPSTPSQSWLVEFVWSNGGGDDNAFSQNVTVAVGGEEAAQLFFDRVEEAMEEAGAAYEFGFNVETEPTQDAVSALEDFQSSLDDVFDGTADLSVIQAAIDSLSLEDVTPLAPKAAARSPSL